MPQAVYRKLVEITIIVQNGFGSLLSTRKVTVGILLFQFTYED